MNQKSKRKVRLKF